MIDQLMNLVDEHLKAPCSVCGKEFGVHSHDGHHCPNPDNGPLYLETRFRDAASDAYMARELNRWIVERGA